MTYAQIAGGVVVNIIVLDDSSLLSDFSAGFDACVEVDNITDTNGDPIGIGWLYSGSVFSPPVAAPPAITPVKLAGAVTCGFAGVAQVGRFLEFTPGNYSYLAAAGGVLTTITVSSSDSATATVQLYNNGVEVASVNMVAQQTFVGPLPEIVVAVGDVITVMITSGSLTAPSVILYPQQ